MKKSPSSSSAAHKSRSLFSALFTSPEKLEAEDRDLVEALRREKPETPALSEEQRAAIEQAWRREASSRVAATTKVAEPRVTGRAWATIGMAAAALALVAVFFTQQETRTPGAPELPQGTPAVAVTPTSTENTSETGETASTASTAKENNTATRPVMAWAARLDDPLAEEQERLIADMKGALRFVAASVLPDPMLNEVDQALAGIETRVEG